jgi:hypothetical protein
MKRDQLANRLTSRIADGVCWVSGAPVELFEEASDGEARVTCTFSPGSVGVFFKLDQVNFPFLRQKKSVDWLVFLLHPDGSLDAHLVECKRTVSWRKWYEIRIQMAASVTRSLALAGALGVEIRHFHSYTAYRNDEISARLSPDPVFSRLPLGPGVVARKEPAETREVRSGQRDWEAAEIRLEGVDVLVTHRRVPLASSSGIGNVELLVS